MKHAMPYKLYFILVTLLYTCTSKPEYPAIVTAHHKEKQYEWAMYEIYKLNALAASKTCDCEVVYDQVGDKKLVMPVLETTARLDTIYFNQDTTTYTFRFYTDDNRETIVFTPGRDYWDCFMFWAIKYAGNQLIPFQALGHESLYMPITDTLYQRMDADFRSCVGKDTTKLNPWLAEFLKK